MYREVDRGAPLPLDETRNLHQRLLEKAIQARARELALEGKILDHRRNRPVTPNKRGIVARHAIAKQALMLLANGGLSMEKRGENS